MTLRNAIPALNWRKSVILFAALCLFVLVLLHPMAPQAPVLAVVILLPVVLFGLVLVPRSLWPAANLDPLVPLPLRARAQLFQRPPPHSLR
jgi:formate hydrogenlyase subunit 4